VTTSEDAEHIKGKMSEFEGQLNTLTSLHDELSSLAAKMRSESINDFSGVTPEDIAAKWNGVKQSAQQKRQAVDQALARHQNNDKICRDFAQEASQFVQWIRQQKETLSKSKGTLEEQLEALQTQIRLYETDGVSKFQKLDAVNKQAEQAGVITNPHTDLTLLALEVEFNELKKATDRQEKVINNELAMKKNADVTPEQLAEFKEAFQHFDKDRNGSLNRLEFKACLQALGDEPTESELDAIIKKLDPEGKTRVTFESFTSFMVEKTKDSDNPNELISSFKSIAGDKEFVTEQDLRQVLQPNRVAYLLAHMPPYAGFQGGYDYKQYVLDSTSR